MNWLTSYVRPKIRALVRPREVPKHLWIKCPGCESMIFHETLEETYQVCPNCEHHMRLDPLTRFHMLFDDGVYHTLELPEVTLDPLKFRDKKRYTDRLKEARSKTHSSDALLVSYGAMGGIETVIAALDFRFMGGSMGIAVGEGFLSASALALEKRSPLIVISASGGARMQEGIFSLMQLPRTVIAVKRIKKARLPYLVILTDPTTGGVTASFAMLGDVQIAERGALVGFAGTRVIEDTIREQIPPGFQTAEFLLEHGMVDMVVDRMKLRETLISVLRLLTERRPNNYLSASDEDPTRGQLEYLPGQTLDSSQEHENSE